MTPLRVLYVEDSPTDRDLAHLQLERESGGEFVMTDAPTLAAAMTLLKAGKFDVVLADLNLGDCKGTETIERLLQAGCAAPIIAFTGSLDARHGVEAVAAGAADFATKGMTDAATLADRIRFAVQRRAAGPTPERLETLVVERTAALNKVVLNLETNRRELAQQKERVDTFMQQVPYCCFLQDTTTGKLVFVSPAYATLFGRPLAALASNPLDWLQVVHPDDQAWVRSEFENAAPGPSRDDREFRVKSPDGNERWLRISWMTMEASGSVHAHRAGVIADITSERALRALEDATRTKDIELAATAKSSEFKTQFLNMAAHDLATPVTPLRLQVATLLTKARMKGDEIEIASLTLLDRNLTRLTGLIQDVLDVARIESGHLRMDSIVMDAAATAKDTLETMRPMAEAGKVTMEADFESASVLADHDRLSQIMLNLLSNAVKFTPSGGRVHLRLRRAGPFARLEVADDGRGIAPGDMAKLFQPFSRVGDVAKVKGTGLGLFICRGLAAKMGGDVQAASPGEGKGSTFTLLVPLATGAPAGAQTPAAAA